ncbi:hypothetical protein JHK85_020037 [Glycine max]|nr:hypothetical protein JHK85_020037 [Glycine max]KAG5038773.1 hypothetical protein JHK86_019613 [Glycine max]
MITLWFPSDSGAFADWSAPPSAVSGRGDDLSLGFNASSATTHGGGAAMWPGASRSFNYNMAPHHDIFVVAPASSFHHHHDHNDAVLSDPNNGSNNSNNNPGTALGVNVFPLLTATPCLESEGIMGNISHHRNRIQLWEDHESSPPQQQQGHVERDTCGDGGLGGSGTNTCQDCGNQAKKDCSHRRCRTCCKSRGFDCATHVKSTWVPASRRRERQLMTVAAARSSGDTSGAKKPRLVASQTTSHTSTSNNTNTTPPRSFDTGSSHQDVGFKESLPCQVRAPAVFKCVRVTAVDDGGEDEYAYQAVVKIGGHVFKGFLYDQGVEDKEGYPNLSELHLGGGNGVSSSSPMVDPSHDVYAASGGGLLLGGSSNYGNHPIN